MAKKTTKYKPLPKSKPATKKVKKPKSKTISVKLQPLQPNPPKQLPETPLTRAGMKLKGLMSNTPKLIRNNSYDVHVMKYQPRLKTASGLKAIKAVMLTKDPFRKDRIPKPRDTYIVGLDRENADKPVAKHKRILVSCSCEYFVFTCEWANAYHGASRIIFSNGEPPHLTNPAYVPHLCKHLYALAQHVIEKGD